MSLIAPLDQSTSCMTARSRVLQVLSRCETVNSIVALLSINFHQLELDVKREQQMRQKPGAGLTDSVLISALTSGPSLEFERSDATRKLRLVLSELLTLMFSPSTGNVPLGKCEGWQYSFSDIDNITLAGQYPSELFDHRVYLAELCDVVAIALAELPVLLQPTEVCEALLKLKYGPEMICHVVANQSDSFNCVVSHLINLGDKTEEEGGQSNSVRQRALLMLARMNPRMTLSMRSLCLEMGRMPGLAVSLSLEHSGQEPGRCDLVSWLSGLILGTQPTHKGWLSAWLRNAAKRKCPVLGRLREKLCSIVGDILECSPSDHLDVTRVRESLAILRLFTALRGIAGMKFTEEEIKLLTNLIIKKPPATKLGVRLAATGLCVLIACNSLLSHQGHERLTGGWLRWLVTWEHCPSEMLLLTAIHFHAGQLSQVADLVCQTLNIKMSVRTNSMSVIKRIFTQEIFTEAVVAQHAVKVPVTASLSASIPGFLPVHCIQQLLKSRVFSKHRVNIKPWIYQQLVSSQAPLHPVLPPLIEAYISSILTTPSNRAGLECHNEPLTEAEVSRVFSEPMLRLNAEDGRVSSSGYTAQLCVLYYILLYEDTRLASTNSRQGLTAPKPHRYSQDLLNDLPIKYLLGKAETLQVSLVFILDRITSLSCRASSRVCSPRCSDWPAPSSPTCAWSRTGSPRSRVSVPRCRFRPAAPGSSPRISRLLWPWSPPAQPPLTSSSSSCSPCPRGWPGPQPPSSLPT